MKALHSALFCLALAAPAWAQDGSVKVTAARANIRAEASDKSPVLTQVVAGTDLILKSVEGEWFRVQLPPDPRLGGARVEAYLSKKVAKLVAMPSATAASDAPKPPEHPERRDGMSVARVVGTGTTWLMPETARLRIVTESAASPRALAGVLPMNDPPLPSAAKAAVTFAWTVSGANSQTVIDDRRPVFVVQFDEVPDVAAGDLVPMLVRITPAVSGVRIISVLRGTMEMTARTESDWDVMKDLKQDGIRASIATPQPGAARVQPDSALEPGEYAIVLRPATGKRQSGVAVFDGPVFGAAWTFVIK